MLNQAFQNVRTASFVEDCVPTSSQLRDIGDPADPPTPVDPPTPAGPHDPLPAPPEHDPTRYPSPVDPPTPPSPKDPPMPADPSYMTAELRVCVKISVQVANE